MKHLVSGLQMAALQAQARRIVSAQVWLGALVAFSAEHFREHFEQESRGTLAQGARLDIEVSDDPLHPSAQQILMRGVELEV